MKATIKCLQSNTDEDHIPLERFPVVLGRGGDAGVQVRSESRFQCTIEEVSGQLVVRDLGSRQGTKLNGCTIRESLLMHGDRITIGNASYEICLDQQA